jgi:UDP-N-acetylglucosamine--N-acetylmuramyl-(pentapeptide) pyrophosphoryl-undecaprenol N-acetylglucosamine transferase
MKPKMKLNNIIFTGGGTGGHIFPAVAIANALKMQMPELNIQFIGALGKMEMQRVPEAGYPIIGLPVRGLIRSISLKNFTVIYNAINSYYKARKILKEFKADIVIGTGGFASLPVCLAATKMGIPLFIWEGNGFAGLTNKLLNKSAKRIYCGFDGMQAHFPHGNWIHSGNPIRQELLEPVDTTTALSYFGFTEKKPTILVIGGSLGARSINEAVNFNIERWLQLGYMIIWQTGKSFQTTDKDAFLWSGPFINDMKYAYHLADIVISRSGALSVSEIMACGIPAVFVPSPNVTDDHQTQNAAKALQSGGAIVIKDKTVIEQLGSAVIDLISHPEQLKSMHESLLKTAKPEATNHIVNDILSHL